jgi:6-phosphogluconolactonase
MRFYMYISVSGEDRISVLTVDSDTGLLEPQSDVEVAGRPAPLAIDPQRRFLYVGRRDSRELSSFRIDPSTGELSLIGSVPLESDPCYLATDRKGRFLLSSYYSAGEVAVHSIDESGTIGGTPVERVATGLGAHSIQTDRSNRFAFVPHIAGPGRANAIFQFKFDEGTGRLASNSPPRLTPEREAGPRHFCFHPSRDIIYFSNEQGCSVTAYRLDSSSGTLTAFQTASTLPGDYRGENSCSQIQISPSGRYLYAPNRGHNSIACFSVDADTGRLASIRHVPTEAVPRVFSLDPEGKFLFAAGLESGRIASYRIEGHTGDLEPLEIYTVGKGLMWVLVTSLTG